MVFDVDFVTQIILKGGTIGIVSSFTVWIIGYSFSHVIRLFKAITK